jgi:glycosyltransferase involved in cell wall biosynthesis
MNPKRQAIAFFCDAAFMGGAVKCLEMLLRARREGDRALVFARKSLVDVYSRAGADVECWDCVRLSVRTLPSFAAQSMRIWFALARRGIRLVHANNLSALYACWLGAVLSGRRIVTHDREFIDATDLSWCERLALRFASTAICITDAVRDNLVAHVPRIRTRVIHDGIDSDDFVRMAEVGTTSRSQLGLAASDFVIGMTSRIAPDKRQLLLVEAASVILRSIPNAKFLIVGSTGSVGRNYWNRIQEEVHRRGLLSRFVFTDHVDSPAAYLAIMDIFVHGSPCEALGLVLLEAMALGKPIVAPRAGGAREVIEEGVSGVLFEPDSSEDLGRRIIQIHGSEELRVLLGAQAAGRVRRRFSEEACLRSTERVYDEIRPVSTPTTPMYCSQPAVQDPVVAYFCDAAFHGGAVNSLSLLMRGRAPAKGTICFARRSMIHHYARNAFRVYEWNPSGLSRTELLHWFLESLRIAAVLSRKKVRLVHANNLSALYSCWLGARLAGCKIIVHDREFLDDEDVTWKSRLALRSVSQVICVTKAVQENLHAIVPFVSSLVIHNAADSGGINAESADVTVIPEALGIKSGSFVIGTASRIASDKHSHLLVSAAAAIVAAVPRAEFLMLGSQDSLGPQYYASLVEQINAQGLADRFHFTGHVGNVPAYMKVMDVFVLTSPHEAFGRVLLEAMALRKPIVAPDTGGAPEVLGPAYRGLLFPAGSAEGLCKAVLLLWNSPVLREELALRGYERCRDEFSCRMHVDSVEGVYDRLSGRG